MRTLLITHTDLDGISPIILLNLIDCKFDYKCYEINELENDLNELLETDLSMYDTIYICDLTIPSSIYQKFDEKKLNYYVFDHHETHLYANENPHVTINIELNNRQTCATEVFYNYLVKEYPHLDTPIIRDYVEQVRQFDTFTFESDKPRDINIIRENIGRVSFIQSVTRRLKKDRNEFTLTNFEKRFTKIQKEKLQRFMEIKEKKMKIYLINNKKCGVVFSENNKSELGSYLSNRHPELDLIILIDASNRISYRTAKNDVKVNEFASIYGGSGHQKASGSKFSDDDRKKIIEDYFEGAKYLDNNE